MSWEKALFLGTPLLMNPFTDSFLVPTNLSPITNSESKPFDRLRVNSISIRCVPPKRDHPASLIQIPKSSERSSIVPHEVLNSLYVHKRALSSKSDLGVRLATLQFIKA